VLLGIGLHHVVYLGGEGVIDVLHLLGEVVLCVLGIAVKLLLLGVDRGSLALLLGGAQCGALGLELLGQVVDLVAQGLELLAAGIILLLQVGEVTLGQRPEFGLRRSGQSLRPTRQ
jgi:hypothetical protein